jgi:hypothetical protein
MAFFGWLLVAIIALLVVGQLWRSSAIRDVTAELDSSVENFSVDLAPYLVENWTRFCLHGPGDLPSFEYPIRSVRIEDMSAASGAGTQFISSISEADDQVVIVRTRFAWLAGEYETSCFDRGRSTVFPIGDHGTDLIYADED